MRLTQPPESITKSPTGLCGRIAVLFATGFGCGYARKAPGTVGSVPGLILGAAMVYGVDDVWHRGGLVAALIVLAIWSIHETEKIWDTHDDQRIVIDEVAGQALAVAFLPAQALGFILGFGLFRLFDIWKPGPIGWADANLPGVWGTLTDDLMAGVVAGLCTWGLVTYVF